jgi:magnesium-transporting ATPase (P-type)
MELVGDSIIYNSTAFIEQTKKDFVPTGNGTEAGLLKFLQDSKVQVQELCESKLGHIRATLPFSSDYKFSAVAVVHPAKQGRIAIYIKGAPEYILEMCHQAISQNQVVNINSVLFEANGAQFSYRDDFNQKVHELAGKPYRVIACAYTEVNLQEWENKENNFETPSDCL